MAKNTILSMSNPNDMSSFLYELGKYKLGDTDCVNVDIRIKTSNREWTWNNLPGKILGIEQKGMPLTLIGISHNINKQKNVRYDIHDLKQKVINYNHDERNVTEKKPLNNRNLDGYSKFRLTGLKSLLKYN